MANYVTNQEVREQAGFQYKERSESIGTGDGSTKIFYTTNKPIVDNDYDGDVDTSDIVVYVAASAVAVTAVVAALGKITITSTPVLAAAITCDYDWTNLDDTTLANYINEAHDLIIGKLSKIYDLPLASTPNIIKLIEKKLAAGLILDKEYSVGGDETEDSRGRRWIKWAEKKLEEIVDGTLELVDSSGTVLSQKSGAGIVGWPDDTTEDEDEEDSGGEIKFRIKKEF